MTSIGKKRSRSCNFTVAIVAVLAVSVSAHPGATQSPCPERSLALIDPYPAGGGTDATGIASSCVTTGKVPRS